MMESDTERKHLRNNPIFLVSIAMVVAILMTFISLLTYYNSETRRTVEQIQQNNATPVAQARESVPSELTDQYVDFVEKQVTNDINGLSAEADYNDELTDAALGL
jgi:hypothetical protein